jgi:hypothetical protein
MPSVEQPPTTEAGYNPELRHKNDAETWLAEVLDGSMRTPFEYTFDGHELYAADGSPMGKVFKDAEVEGVRIAQKDPRLSFEPRRRKLESEEYQCMLAMARGELPNTMIILSDFPAELMNEKKSVGGYNVDRKQTMLRVITWNGHTLAMQSQTLDQSNRQASEAIYQDFGLQAEKGELLGQRIHTSMKREDQAFAVDWVTGVYDRSLHQQTGREWRSGRPLGDLENTYDFVQRNQDVVQRVARLYANGDYSSSEVYDCAATLKKRFEVEKISGIGYEYREAIPEWDIESRRRLEQELYNSGVESRSNGDDFNGCGASVVGAEDQLEQSGYGNKKDETGDCDFISKECPSCGERNVKTHVRNINGKRHVSGSCGCKKVY